MGEGTLKNEREPLSESTPFFTPGRCYFFLIHSGVPFRHKAVSQVLVEGECVLAHIAAGRETLLVSVAKPRFILYATSK